MYVCVCVCVCVSVHAMRVGFGCSKSDMENCGVKENTVEYKKSDRLLHIITWLMQDEKVENILTDFMYFSVIVMIY